MHTTLEVIDLGNSIPVSGFSRPHVASDPFTTSTTTGDDSAIRLPGSGHHHRIVSFIVIYLALPLHAHGAMIALCFMCPLHQRQIHPATTGAAKVT